MNEPFHQTICAGFERQKNHSVDEKVAIFFDMFSVPLKDRQAYQPLFLFSSQSSSGELAPSFGLFLNNGNLYEVHGSECSVWDFEGQWEPEETTIESLHHRMTIGHLGHSEDHPFADDLVLVLDRLQLQDEVAPAAQRTPHAPSRKI